MNSPDADAEIDKVNFHLSTICDKKGIVNAEENVSVVFVDALTALEGKLENEDELIDESNIEQLEIKIDELLGKSGNEEVTNALNLYVSKYINRTIDVIDNKIDNPEMKKTQELITYLEKLKQRTEIELKNIAMDSVGIATANLLELMLGKDKNSIEAMIKRTTDEVIERINQKFKQVHEELKSKVDEFKGDFETLIIHSENINLSDTNIEDIATSDTDSGTNDAIMAGAGVAVNAIPPVIPVGPYPIPARAIAQVALALFSIFSGSNEAKTQAKAELDAKRQQHLSAKNRTEEFGIKYKNDLMDGIDINLDKTFNELIQGLINLANKLEGKNSKLLKDKEHLHGILDTL